MILDRSTQPSCNIGPAEVGRRRRSAITASVFFAVVVVAALVLQVPPAWRLLLWPLASAVAVTWLQVVRRFCVAFAALGIQNFGRLGDQVSVESAILAEDRRRALRMILEGAAIGLGVTLLVVVIPV